MSKLIELENPDAMGINAIYYKGLKKRQFLGNKKKVLSQIPKGLVLGLGYTIWGEDLHDGRSMDDIEHLDRITEYVFIKNPDEEDPIICFELLSEMVFSERSKDSNGIQLEDYINELEKHGYIWIPITFRWEKSSEEMVEDFGLAKRKK